MYLYSTVCGSVISDDGNITLYLSVSLKDPSLLGIFVEINKTVSILFRCDLCKKKNVKAMSLVVSSHYIVHSVSYKEHG